MSSTSRTTSADRRQPKPRRLKDSCDECAASKVKCTREQPHCTRCLTRGLPCTYSTSRRRGKHKASPIVKKNPEWRQTYPVPSSSSLPIPIPYTHTNGHAHAHASTTLLPASYSSTTYGDALSTSCYSRDATPFYDSDPSSVYNDPITSFAAYLPDENHTGANICGSGSTMDVFFAAPDYHQSWGIDTSLPTIPMTMPISISNSPPSLIPTHDCKALALQTLLDTHIPRHGCPATQFYSISAAHIPTFPASETHALQVVDRILSCRCAADASVTLLIAQILSSALAGLTTKAVAENRNTSEAMDIESEVTQALFQRVQCVGGLVERLCNVLNDTRGRGGVRKAWETVDVQAARELKGELKEATREILRGTLFCA